MTEDNFYRAFEERHRGPRALIQARLRVYLPYIRPMLSLYGPSPVALDLGCGRGEWLELAQAEGFAAQGIDIDSGMLEACRELQLPTVQGDALAHLQHLDDDTLTVVTGFHLAEHIAFADLRALVAQSLRVLKPGGLLILETPNPENIAVGSHRFYLDPTHQRPLPPELLSFVPQHAGFARVEILRLQEERRLTQDKKIQLIDVLAGASPDYAVVAQKKAAPEILQMFDSAFDQKHGLTLESLAQRFDAWTEHQAQAREQAFTASLRDQLAPLVEQLALAHQARDAALAERDALRQSLSWRLTAWLRALADWRQTLPTAVLWLPRTSARAGRAAVVQAMRLVLRSPGWSSRINRTLLRYPFLHQRLAGLARRGGLMAAMHGYGGSGFGATPADPALADLTVEAQQVYGWLQAAAARAKGQG